MRTIFAIFTLVVSFSSAADIIYSEDFSTDPGFTSLAPSYTYWDSTDENFYLETYRNDDEKYWAYKELPSFRSTELDTISVDIYYETLNTLTYPSVRFYQDEPIDISSTANPDGIGFSQYNCCGDPNRFVVYDRFAGSQEISTSHITSGIWYNILMEFSADMTFDTLVTEKATGDVLLNAQDMAYADIEYGYIGMGYYTSVSPDTGPTTMLVDNIEITTVPAPSLAFLFLAGLISIFWRSGVQS